jgi:hypothetical protein
MELTAKVYLVAENCMTTRSLPSINANPAHPRIPWDNIKRELKVNL